MSKKTNSQTQKSVIPDLVVVDLEEEIPSTNQTVDSNIETDMETAFAEPAKKTVSPLNKILSCINIHVVLAVIVFAVVILTVYKFKNWGEYIDLNEIFKDGPGEHHDTLDFFLPLTDSHGVPIKTRDDDGETVIVAFGNAPFADDRDSEDNLANMIANMTGATVYNCSISGSYLASLPFEGYAVEQPINAFNLYWLCRLTIDEQFDESYLSALEALGDEAPAEAQEVYQTIKSIDFDKVDVITIMYDASDYLAGHPMYNDDNSTDVLQFTGNLEASIELLRFYHPQIRIIVLSPTYAFSDKIDEETGKYISSDLVRYGQDVLSTYVIKQYNSCSNNAVTFVDNLYGTITGVNAEQYLIDNLHLNVAGRKKVAERFVEALEYFD